MVTDQDHKVLENRLRRMALRQGLTVMKSRRRDPMAFDFNGYMIADDRNVIVAGTHPNAYSMSIEEVERFLLDGTRPRYRKAAKDGQLRWHIPAAAKTA